MSSLRKNVPVTKTTQRYVAAEPKVEKRLVLDNTTNEAVVKTYIVAYRKEFQKPENQGAPWYSAMVKAVAFARSQGWAVDEWLKVKVKPRCPTCNRVGRLQGKTLDGDLVERPQKYKCMNKHEWEVENKP